MSTGPQTGAADGDGSAPATTMRTIRQDRYGGPDVLELATVEMPVPEPDEVLLRVEAAGTNPLDWHFMRGEPYVMRASSGLRRPKNPHRGVDVAGRVEAVGEDVTEFESGDAVFGWCWSAFSEYACVEADTLLSKPDSLSFEEAAGVSMAATTALQGLRDEGELAAGQSVLINGASGGVGTFAVQIADHYDAAVTGVCSTRNLELVQSLGADHVVDYTAEDFTRSGETYDVVFDLVGNRSLSDLRRVVAPQGSLVLSGGEGGPILGPIALMVRAMVRNRFVDQDIGSFVAENDREDLEVLCDLLESGDITPVIDRTYPLEETAAAIRYLEKGHARGKVIVTVDHAESPTE